MAMSKKEQRLRRANPDSRTHRPARRCAFDRYRSNLHIYASVISGDGSKVLACLDRRKEVRDQLKNGGNATKRP